MTDAAADAWGIRQRAFAALDAADATIEAMVARQAARQEQGERDRLLPQQPSAVAALPRAPRRPVIEGRNWQAEERWISGIVDQKLAGLAEAIGSVVASERARHRGEIDILKAEIAELRAELDALKAEAEQHRGAAPHLAAAA